MGTTDRGTLIITGAGGFFGGRAFEFFATERTNEWKVIATSRRTIADEKWKALGASFVKGDLSDPEFCDQLCKNADVIVHAAALSSPWGQYADFYSANVTTTKNLLRAAIANNIKKFIYISTPSVYFDYTDKLNIKESDAFPAIPANHYAATKLEAEKLVLDANSDKMKTIALRPRAIIGAGDTVIFPRLIKAYLDKKLKIIGTDTVTCDLTCARNLIEAVEKCFSAKEEAYGHAYNITNGAPVILWEKINYILRQLGYTPVTKKVPKQIALTYGSVTETWHKLFYPHKEPPVTRYSLAALSVNMTLDITKAKNKLGYVPVQNNEEGIKEFLKWYKAQQ